MSDKKTIINKKQFVTDYLLTNNGTQSVLKQKPHLSSASAAVNASRVLKDDNVQKMLSDALTRAGFGLDDLSSKMQAVYRSGIGKKGTNRDALKVIELATKVHLDQVKVKEEKKTEYDDLETQSLMEELKSIKSKLNAHVMNNTVEGKEVKKGK